MKYEMRPYPDVTLRRCDKTMMSAAYIAHAFRSQYEDLQNRDCVYSNSTGSYYAKCTCRGNIIIDRVGEGIPQGGGES